jgi:hypothetical protein
MQNSANMSSAAANSAPTLQLPHDIILPQAIGAWPLAYGWWLVMALCLLLLTATLYLRWQRRRAQAPLRAALAQLINIAQHSDERRFLSDSAHWLKRQAIYFYGREQAAALNGDAWLKFLDDSGNTQDFTQGPGRALLTLYQPTLSLQREALRALLETWLRQQFSTHKGRSHRV